MELEVGGDGRCLLGITMSFRLDLHLERRLRLKLRKSISAGIRIPRNELTKEQHAMLWYLKCDKR